MNYIPVNTIHCGDNKDIIRSIESESVDVIICDPPYLTTNESWDKKEEFDEELMSELFRVLKKTGHIYCWCGIGEKSQSLMRWFPILSKFFHFKDLITWKKQRGHGMRKGWLYTREEIMWFVKDNKSFFWNKDHQYSTKKRVFTATYKNKERMKLYQKSVKSDFKRLTNVWTDIRETNISWNKKDKIKFHFTPKPLKALERIILTSCPEDGLLLSPYCGSGQDVISAIKTKRKYIGIEKNQKYFDLIKKRIDMEKAINEKL